MKPKTQDEECRKCLTRTLRFIGEGKWECEYYNHSTNSCRSYEG
jgi:ribosomal protein L37AE/L43A